MAAVLPETAENSFSTATMVATSVVTVMFVVFIGETFTLTVAEFGELSSEGRIGETVIVAVTGCSLLLSALFCFEAPGKIILISQNREYFYIKFYLPVIAA